MSRVRLAVSLLVALLVPALAGGATAAWQRGAPLPLARGEVAAAVDLGSIYVLGGFTADGQNSNRVEAYSPGTNTWRQEADLPVPVDHAMAAGHRGRVYVAGGYGANRRQLTSLFAFTGDGWTRLAPMPQGRAAERRELRARGICWDEPGDPRLFLPASTNAASQLPVPGARPALP